MCFVGLAAGCVPNTDATARPTQVAGSPTSPLLPSGPAPTITTTVSPAPPATAEPSPQISPTSSLAGVLTALVVAPEQRDGYTRTLFRLWIDADGDGCDTRREVLIDEAVIAPAIGSNCTLSGGSWLSTYDGLTFTDPRNLDIDHVVPLAEAWDSGAYGWDPDRRKRFANDLDVDWALIAVSAASNRSKGDQDPADWLPPAAAFRCTYTAMWIEVKARWRLTIDAAEQAALTNLVAACPTTSVEVVVAP